MKTLTRNLAIALLAAFAAFAVIPAQAGDGGCCANKGIKGGASCNDKATSGGCEKKSSCDDKATSGGCEKK
jgi:hypothetical protein